MKRGEYGGMDTLRHIVSQRVPLGEAYDRRAAPAKVKAMGGQRNIEPLVDEWFAWKSDPQRKRGQKSAGEYRKQVRKLIVNGKPFLLSRFTAENLYEFLVGALVR